MSRFIGINHLVIDEKTGLPKIISIKEAKKTIKTLFIDRMEYMKKWSKENKFHFTVDNFISGFKTKDVVAVIEIINKNSIFFTNFLKFTEKNDIAIMEISFKEILKLWPIDTKNIDISNTMSEILYNNSGLFKRIN